MLGKANITRFITGCQKVGLPNAEIFGLHDLGEQSSQSLSRIARTVIVLSRLAGVPTVAIGRRSSSLPAVRAPSSPQRTTMMVPLQPRRPHRVGVVIPPSGPPVLLTSHQPLSSDHAMLQVGTDRSVDSEGDLSGWRTPTTSMIGLPSGAPTVSDSSTPQTTPIARRAIQPTVSPSIRPKSPLRKVSPDRATIPIGQPFSLALRPALRPRHTTDGKTQVSFADEHRFPSSARTRTTDQCSSPSRAVGDLFDPDRPANLVNSASKVSSGGTLSSTAFPMAIVTRDDHMCDIDVTGENKDVQMTERLRGRQLSEKRLEDARQKIFRAVLSKGDSRGHSSEADRQAEEQSVISDNARVHAYSQSLAALEGRCGPLPPNLSDFSPRRRPGFRREQSLEVSRQDVDRVPEEEEQSSAASSWLLAVDVQPSVVRRLSANGKIDLTGSTTSVPSSSSPAAGGFPLSTSESARAPPGILWRRQSDGSPSSLNTASSPMNTKHNSMINLAIPSVTPSFLRETSANSVTKAVPLQIVEFREPAFIPVRYVSRSHHHAQQG